MLSRSHRLGTSRLFEHAVRRGRRAGSRTLVVHAAAAPDDGVTPRVGFVVSRAVGGAVTRNRVKRRLRHLVGERLAGVPRATVLVVRALPPAAEASYAGLGRDLDHALGRALAGADQRASARGGRR